METIYLLLGSNQGDRLALLAEACSFIRHYGNIQSQSAVYRTKPWGNMAQPDFLNLALELKSEVPPEELLKNLKNIEERLGRTSSTPWGPRHIDIDIIFYGDIIFESPTLIIPHPRMQDRKFVLIPLAEIAPQFIHPVYQKTVSRLLEECPDTLDVVQLD